MKTLYLISDPSGLAAPARYPHRVRTTRWPKPSHVAAALLFVGFAVTAATAFAQTPIDQAKALAGNVTPGDAPGFPVTINQPGHYKLTGNLTVPVNATGIEIMAEDVTLDLNGYTVRGPVACQYDSGTRVVTCSDQGVGHYGVVSNRRGTVVRNGTVRGFAGTGVMLVDVGSVENLRVSQNSGKGVSLMQGNAVGVEAEGNLMSGITVTSGIVTRSSALKNGAVGIDGDYIQESLAKGNRTYGMVGQGARASVSADNGFGNFYSPIKSMGGNLNGATPW